MSESLPRWARESVGRLPPGCATTTIGKLGKLISGSTPPRAQPEKYFNGGRVPWVKTGDLTNADIVSTQECVTDAAVRECRCIVHPPGTLLIAMYGGFEQIGRTGILRISAATNQAITAVRFPIGSPVSPEFLQTWLNHMKPAWRRIAGSSRKDPNVTKADIAAFPVLVPSGSAIVKMDGAMALFGNLLGLLSAARSIKQTFKRGLMQQLLTGQRRFPEFEGCSWAEVYLGDVFEERNETNRPDLPLLSVTGERGIIPRDELEKRDTSNPDKTKYKRVAIGDVAYNTMRMWQGVSALSALDGIVSPAYTVTVPTERIYGPFARHLFKFPPVVNLFHRHSQGLVDDTLNLKFDRFAKIKLLIPSHTAEQARIAGVLDLFDQEMDLLAALRDLIDVQKRALLSKLLSGEIEVPA